jgi:hypothetical protein
MDTSTQKMSDSTAELANLMNDDQKYIAAMNTKIDLLEKDLAGMKDEVGSDRQFLEAAVSTMKGISDSISDMAKMGKDFQTLLKPMVEKTADPKTPDALDILRPAQGT